MAAAFVAMPGSQYCVYRSGLIILKASIDGVVQYVEAKSLQARMVLLSHYYLLSGRPGHWHMHDKLLWVLMDPHGPGRLQTSRQLSKNPQTARKQWTSATSHTITCQQPPRICRDGHIGTPTKDVKRESIRNCHEWQVFQAYLCSTFTENQSFACCTDIYQQLGYASRHPQLSFNGYRTLVCEKILERSLPLPRCQNANSNSESMANERWNRAENKAIFARLRQYVNELQSNWDLFVQLLCYAYNQVVQQSTQMNPSSLSITCDPPDAAVQDLPTGLLHDASQAIPPKQIRLHILHRLCLMRTKNDMTLKVHKKGKCNTPISRYETYHRYAQATLFMSIARPLCSCQLTTYLNSSSGSNGRKTVIKSPAEICWPILNYRNDFTQDLDRRRWNTEWTLNQPSDTGSKTKKRSSSRAIDRRHTMEYMNALRYMK